jgi:type IV conjugative transfer system protein TraL
MSRPVEIPRHVDDPPTLLLWRIDDLVPVVLMLVLGILAGDLVYLVFALFGLAAIATWFGPVFVVIKWASALYLLYIAWQFWTALKKVSTTISRPAFPDVRTSTSCCHLGCIGLRHVPAT